MKCPQCGSLELVKGGAPVSTGGAIYYPRRCGKCGFFWSPKQPLPAVKGVPPAADEFPPLDSPPPPEKQETQGGAEKIVRAAGGFDPAKVKPGDVVLFVDAAGVEKRLAVVSVAPKSILGDVDGKPDQRVKRSVLTGCVVLE